VLRHSDPINMFYLDVLTGSLKLKVSPGSEILGGLPGSSTQMECFIGFSQCTSKHIDNICTMWLNTGVMQVLGNVE